MNTKDFKITIDTDELITPLQDIASELYEIRHALDSIAYSLDKGTKKNERKELQ